MRRILGVSVCAVACAGFLSSPAGATDHPSFEVPLDTVVRGDAGSEHLLVTESVPADAVGRGCDVVVEGENNDSVHPGNDLIVRSGDTEVVASDVEREPGAVTEASGTITLGEEFTVTLLIGEDEVFSGGLVVTLDCPIPPPPTTAPEETTTTTAPTTTTTAPDAAPPAAPAVPVPGEPTYTG